MGKGIRLLKQSLAWGSVELENHTFKTWTILRNEGLRASATQTSSGGRGWTWFQGRDSTKIILQQGFKDAKPWICYVRDVIVGTSQDWDFTAVAHVSHKVQSSNRETPRRKQGTIAIYFLWEWENELEKGISRATGGPKNSKSTRDGNAPQGMSQIPTTPERFSELRYNSYCHCVSYQHSSTHWKIFWLFRKRGRLSKPALAPNAAGWKLVPGSVLWFPGGNLLPCPCPRHISSRVCPPPLGKNIREISIFFLMFPWI